ncbi:MAG: Gfo/Idh/MocA family oxidoreductase [Candidatus Edwardsbacteria bacterium]
MSEKKLGVGVIGIGVIAQLAHLPAFSKFKDANLVALCDFEEAKAKKLAEKYGVKKLFTDFEKLLKCEEVQAVVIATPNYLHAPMTIAALEAGKHVLCERPMALNADQAKEMVKAAEKAKRRLAIGFNNRFRPEVQILKRFLEGEELGEVFYVKAGWLRRRTDWRSEEWLWRKKTSGGGVFLDLGIHLLDTALWLIGNLEVNTVSASLYKREKSQEIEDSGVAFIKTKKGGTLSLEVSWTLVFERDLTYMNFFGEKGAALLNPLRIHKEMHGELVNVTPTTKIPADSYRLSYYLQAGNFVEAVLQNREPLVSGEDGLKITELLDAIYQSAKEGKEVKIS